MLNFTIMGVSPGVFKIPYKPHFIAHTITPISILVSYPNFYFRLMALNEEYFGQSALCSWSLVSHAEYC